LRFFKKFLGKEMKEKSLPGINGPSISFCTTCMGRLWQLEQTLLQNIEQNRHVQGVEFVLLNYNSPDSLDTWAQNHLRKYIEEGILNYYRTTEPTHFHMSHAKNVALKLARGEIVCNVDADNFLEEEFVQGTLEKFRQKGLAIICKIRWSPENTGLTGRIAISKGNFLRLGGYDESFKPMGFQDVDFLERAKRLGIKCYDICPTGARIDNSKEEKVELCEPLGMNWYEMNEYNRQKGEENLRNRKYIANENKEWGKATLIKNFSERVFLF